MHVGGITRMFESVICMLGGVTCTLRGVMCTLGSVTCMLRVLHASWGHYMHVGVCHMHVGCYMPVGGVICM